MIHTLYNRLSLFLVALFMGCKKKIPDTVLPESKMEEILYDYHLAKYMAEQLPNNEKYKKIYLHSTRYSTQNQTAENKRRSVWWTKYFKESCISVPHM